MVKYVQIILRVRTSALSSKSRGGSDDHQTNSIPAAHGCGEVATQGHDADAPTVDLPPWDSPCLEPGEINANIKTVEIPIIGCTPNVGIGEYGPSNDLLKFGCFGPFPSNFTFSSPANLKTSSIPNSITYLNVVASGRLKRRWTASPSNNDPNCSSNIHAPLLAERTPPIFPSLSPITHKWEDNVSVECNSASTCELAATAEVGTTIGFEIKANDQVLA